MKWIIPIFAVLLSLPATAAGVKVEGTVLSVARSEEHVYLTGEAGHRNQYMSEFDVTIEAPKEYAGLRCRFGFYTEGPVSYADWKGKKVVVTLADAEPTDRLVFPQAIVLKDGANQALVPTATAVTPAADAPVAPAAAAAHL